jgi:hypothetical protein
MFDFAPVGGAVALVGIIFVAFIGWRLVATRRTSAGTSVFEIESYLFEIKIPRISELHGKTIKEV